jgi:hypothetical protein
LTARVCHGFRRGADPRPGELGWVDGRNVTVEYRRGQGVASRAGEIAAEYAARNVDVVARALGLGISPTLLALADEVIE